MLRLLGGWRVLAAGAALVWLALGLLVSLHKYEVSIPSREAGAGGRTGGHWMGFTGREARLAQRVREAEDQVQWLKLQLANTQKRMSQEKQRRDERVGVAGEGCDNLPPPCEEIQVAIVCAGPDASRTVVTLVKSILFYRRNPIHFHFISDSKARGILATLFSTWRIPEVNTSFYETEKVVNDVDWIPNKHYSGVFGLLKLTLPKILPVSLDKVIILDTDVTFATDIGKLWTIFNKFNKQQALGLVENQSDWYIPGKLWKNHRPWPALGRGLNTGVILMIVSRLRAINWSQTWRTVAESDLVTQLSTSLADQDVLNAVIKRESGLLYKLDCKWNVQMSDNSLSDSLCYDTKSSEVNVIHFNSPKKVESSNKHMSYFRNLYLTFLQYDGNLLRRELYSCQTEDTDTNTALEDRSSQADETSEAPCAELTANQSRVYRTHVNFLPHCLEEEPSDSVTLVAQLSSERLSMLEPILAHWTGPVSLALYLTDPESQSFLDLLSSSSLLSGRCNVGYHVVYKEGPHYPVNMLRNLALEQAVSEFVFLSDIDLIPSPGSSESLRSSLPSVLSDHPDRVLVVPAFENTHYSSQNFPATKADLIKMLDVGEIFTFRSKEWPQGHRPTNIPHWRTATIPFTVKWEPDYEPYIVARRVSLPRYDTRFVGFGWNKVSHIMELAARSVEFVVVPDVFMVHQPHSASPDLGMFRSSQMYRDCVMRLKREFVRDLENRTGKKLYNEMFAKDML